MIGIFRTASAFEAETQTCCQSEIENLALDAGLYFGNRPDTRPFGSGNVQPNEIMAKAG
jgi:hypothetical protein